MADQYRYVHDEEKKTVYRFPCKPQVTEQRVGRGKKKIWHYVRMQIDVDRADNVLTGNQWLYPTSEYPNFTYDDRYDAEDAAHYFMRNYTPVGNEISAEQYDELLKCYRKNNLG